MFKVETIINQVLENCAISESRQAGLYSVCGLVLRMRDLYKWEKGFALNKSGQMALKFVLEEYGLKTQDRYALREHLARISEAEVETYLYHELGEIKEHAFDREIWRNIVGTFPHTPIELLTRSVKDLLADTNEYGRLSYITRERKTASLGLYVAFFDLKRDLFPELTDAFKEFKQTRKWGIIEEVTSIGYRKAEQYAQELCSLYVSGKEMGDMDWVEEEIGNRLLRPLGLGVNSTEGE